MLDLGGKETEAEQMFFENLPLRFCDFEEKSAWSGLASIFFTNSYANIPLKVAL